MCSFASNTNNDMQNWSNFNMCISNISKLFYVALPILFKPEANADVTPADLQHLSFKTI